MRLLFLDGTQVTSDVCPLRSALNVGSDTCTRTLGNTFEHWRDKRVELALIVTTKFNVPPCAISRSDTLSREIVPETTIGPPLHWMASVSRRDPELLYQLWPGKQPTHWSDGLGLNKDYSLGPNTSDLASRFLFFFIINAQRRIFVFKNNMNEWMQLFPLRCRA